MPNDLERRILIIEDNLEICRLFARMIETLGYRPMLASSGLAGIEILESQPISLLIVDLIMPEMSGWEVIRHVRAKNLCGPVIAISGSIELTPGDCKDPLQAALDAGADYALRKPFSMHDFQVLVRTCLRENPAKTARCSSLLDLAISLARRGTFDLRRISPFLLHHSFRGYIHEKA